MIPDQVIYVRDRGAFLDVLWLSRWASLAPEVDAVLPVALRKQAIESRGAKMTSERDYPRRIDNGSTRTEIVLTGVAAPDEAQPGMVMAIPCSDGIVWLCSVLKREEKGSTALGWRTHLTPAIALPADPMLNAEVTSHAAMHPEPLAMAGSARGIAYRVDPETVERWPVAESDDTMTQGIVQSVIDDVQAKRERVHQERLAALGQEEAIPGEWVPLVGRFPR